MRAVGPGKALLPLLAAGASLAAVLAVTPAARADASAWAFVGGGAMTWKQSEEPTYTPAGAMVVEGGVGTSPEGPVIIGGVFRFQPIMPHEGVDLSFLARLATHGFQAGDWGLAIDAGFFARPWGARSIGFAGSASLGLPLGFTIMGIAEAGVDHAFTFGAVAGIDLLRLTVYRKTALKWWQNPSGAGTITAFQPGALSF